MNKLPSFTPQALYRLKKIVQLNPNNALARRANAMLLQAVASDRRDQLE